MRRKEIAKLIERYDEHERYGELTEDDRITHWLMKKVYEMTKWEQEEPEVKQSSKSSRDELREMVEVPQQAAAVLFPALEQEVPWHDRIAINRDLLRNRFALEDRVLHIPAEEEREPNDNPDF